MKSILDRAFRYIPSTQTDLKKTFARVRREQAHQKETHRQNAQEAEQKVAPLNRADIRKVIAKVTG